MTEEEAKSTRCHKDNRRLPCIASKCMAWRTSGSWTKIPEDNPAKHPFTFRFDDGLYADNRTVSNGFCGLAGKP